MTSLLLDCAIRAALIVVGTALVLWILRIRRAAACHAAWAAVVLAMLALPLWSLGGPKLSLRVLQPTMASRGLPPPATIAPTVLPSIPDTVVAKATTSPSAQPSGPSWSGVVVGLYLVGALVLLLRLAVGTLYALRLRRNATTENGRATSERCAAPITIGWLAPTLILPRGWQAWPAEKLSAVLTHEDEHARRRDPLVQWLALLNRALFWFHPLAWWLERRLATLAEESCDAVVLAAGHSPEAYSEYLLDMVRTVATRGERLRAVGMAMPGSGLKERMRLILNGASAAPLSRVRMACTVVFCAASTVLFAGATLSPRTSSSADAPWHANPNQGPEGAIPKFDVVSIKPCKAADALPGARDGGPGRPVSTPGRLHIDCLPLAGQGGLIRRAYGTFAGGTHKAFLPPSAVPVEGGPAWTTTDRYTIDATTDGTPTVEMMNGPMLRALLADRFQLKLRVETRDIPVYDLTVAKGGSKLTPFDGRCTPVDFTKGNIPAQLEAQGSCPIAMHDTRVDAPGQTIGDFITFVLVLLDRPVIDKTGLMGRYDIHLNFTPEDGHVIEDLTATLATSVQQQLGLKLVPAKGLGEFVVIDRVERPTPNDAPASQAPTSSPQTAAPPQATQFDVVSIKPTTAFGPPFIELVGDRWTAPHPGVGLLVQLAYGVNPAQIVGLPTWAQETPFRIEAKLPPNASAKDLPLMLQSMLADRFRLIVHRESRTLKVRTITIAKEGLKLRPATGACSTDPAEDLKVLINRRRCGEMIMSAPFPNYQYGVVYRGLSVSMADVAAFFNTRGSSDLFVDETGLKGLYDVEVNLDYTPPSDMDPHQLSDEQTAYRKLLFHKGWLEQAGLILDARADRVVPVLVIDRLERPTPNGPVAVLK